MLIVLLSEKASILISLRAIRALQISGTTGM